MSLQLPSGHFMLSLSFPSPQRAPCTLSHAKSFLVDPEVGPTIGPPQTILQFVNILSTTFCPRIWLSSSHLRGHSRPLPICSSHSQPNWPHQQVLPWPLMEARILWDLQRSGSIHSHLNQSASSCPGWLTSQTTSLSYFVLCIRGRVPVQHQHHQTFHQIPVLPSEQGFTATSVGANFFLLRVLIFGPAVRPQWGVASPHGSADPPTFKRTAAARPSSSDPRRPSLLIPNPKPPFAEPLRPAAPPLPFLRPTRRRAAVSVTEPFRTPDTLCISLTPLAPRTRRAAASLQLTDSIITLPFGCCPDTCPQDDTEDLSEASIQIHVSSK